MSIDLDYDALARGVISFFIPGLGQFINGNIGKGIKILVGFIVIWLLLLFLNIPTIHVIVGVILRLVAGYDAYMSYDPS